MLIKTGTIKKNNEIIKNFEGGIKNSKQIFNRNFLKNIKKFSSYRNCFLIKRERKLNRRKKNVQGESFH